QCNRRTWFTEQVKHECSLLTKGRLFEDGLFEGLPQGFTLSTDLLRTVFGPWFHETDFERAWEGPLVVLANRYTCSAAESFAKALHDHAGALLLGERTDGAGGGWLFGDEGFVLPYSRLCVAAPDSVLFLKDGRNARFGIEPDVCLDWRTGTSLF